MIKNMEWKLSGMNMIIVDFFYLTRKWEGLLTFFFGVFPIL